MESLAVYCAGSSHERRGLPVQDRALSRRVAADGGEVCVLALADGHGGDEHFRSDIGAAIATEVVAELLPDFMAELGAAETEDMSVGAGEALENAADTLVRAFLGRVMAQWCSRVLAHRHGNPADAGLQSPARAYGCTLLGAACRDGLWFAFQLGDGAMLALDDSGALLCLEPDPRCEGNLTTSMCNCGAADFRYRLGHTVPAVLMLCSDGLEGCYDSREAMLGDFLDPVIENIAAEGMDDTAASLAELLPSMSEQYTHDDMSVALWADTGRVAALSAALVPKITDRYRADLAHARAEYEEISQARAALEADAAELRDAAEISRKRSVIRTLDRQLAGLAEEIEFYEMKLNG